LSSVKLRIHEMIAPFLAFQTVLHISGLDTIIIIIIIIIVNIVVFKVIIIIIIIIIIFITTTELQVHISRKATY
jgi:hypothetical protein